MFKLDDIIIDRIQMAVAEDFSGNLLYTLTQLSEASIETTAEAKEARSAEGTLIKKFYQGKAGTFTATNAMINLNVIGAASGSEKQIATTSNTIKMPKIEIVNYGTATLNLDSGFVSGTAKVYALGNNGAMGQAYTLDTSADATHFAISGTTLTLPVITTTADQPDRFVVKYERTTSEGIKLSNSADKFPGTVKLTLKALCVDPCSPDTVRACYIILPSFQVSPELTITLTTEGTLDYKGDLQVDYCSSAKELYSIVMCGDDEE